MSKKLLTFPRILPKPWKYKAHKSPLALRCTPPCICSRWKCDPQEMSCNGGGEAVGYDLSLLLLLKPKTIQRWERGTRPNCLHSHSVFCPVFLLQAAAATFLQRMFRLKCPLPVQSESNVNCMYSLQFICSDITRQIRSLWYQADYLPSLSRSNKAMQLSVLRKIK